MAKYDANIRLNVTVEYDDDEDQRPGDVREDLRSLFEGCEVLMSGAHAWVTEVISTGRPSRFE